MAPRERNVLLLVLALAYAVSAWKPADAATWWMEVLPVFFVLPLVASLERRIGLTALALRLLAFEALVVALGAHYTYAEVPLGFWIGDALGLVRNHYDRLAHFFQGVVPAIALRELLLRTSPLGRGRWLFVVVSSMCLAMSALYEFVEWGAALVFADGATAFLGTQGDPWDTQWDMLLALAGSIAAQHFLAGLHDRQMRTQDERRAGPRL